MATLDKKTKLIMCEKGYEWNPNYIPRESDNIDVYIYLYNLAQDLRILVDHCDIILKKWYIKMLNIGRKS